MLPACGGTVTLRRLWGLQREQGQLASDAAAWGRWGAGVPREGCVGPQTLFPAVLVCFHRVRCILLGVITRTQSSHGAGRLRLRCSWSGVCQAG